jgi:hypothetical protein
MPTFLTPDPPLLEPGPIFEVQGEEIDPAQHGYTAVHNYALYFWRPYLGNTAFALWELLLSFCYGDCDTAFPSISRLARMLTNSDQSRATVTGRRGGSSAGIGFHRRERRGNEGTTESTERFGCHAELAAEPPSEASGPTASAGGPGDSAQDDKSHATDVQSSPPQRPSAAPAGDATPGTDVHDDAPSRACEGALAVLRREGLVQVMQRGQGPTLNYTFRVCKALPLLWPDQVQRLCPGLQRDHGNWLDRYGIDAALYLSAFDPAEAGERGPHKEEGGGEGASPSPHLSGGGGGGEGSPPSPHLSGVTLAPTDTAGALPPGAMQAPTTDAGAAGSATGGPGCLTPAVGAAAPAGARSTNNPSDQEDPLKNLWQAALAELRLQLPRHDVPWRTMHTLPFRLEDGVLTVHVYYPAQHDFLHHRLTRTVGRVLGEVTHGRVSEVHFVLVEKDASPAGSSQ